MKQQIIIEKPPQAFVPGSRAAKRAGILTAKKVLEIAKSQNRKVIRLAPGASGEFKKKDTEVLPIDLNKNYGSADTAILLGIKVTTLQQHKQSGKIKAEKINGRLMYSGAEIERFKAARS